RKVLDPSAADEDDRVLLEVVPLTRDVRADLHAVRQPHARDLAQRRVRLLRSRRVHARADTALLWRAAERRRLHLRLLREATLAHELIDGRHGKVFSLLTHNKSRQGGTPPTPGLCMVANPHRQPQTQRSGSMKAAESRLE